MRDGDRVWLITPENQLRISEVEIVWRDSDETLVRGMSQGDRLIVSNLPTPIDGMPVRVLNDNESGSQQSQGITMEADN